MQPRSPPPPRQQGTNCALESPREPLNQRLSELKGTPELTRTPRFTEVKTQGSETFRKELKATQHAKAEEQEKPTSGQPVPISLHGYSRSHLPSYRPLPWPLPLPVMKTSDLRTHVLTVKMAFTWPCPPKVASRAPKKPDQAAEEAEPELQAPQPHSEAQVCA